MSIFSLRSAAFLFLMLSSSFTNADAHLFTLCFEMRCCIICNFRICSSSGISIACNMAFSISVTSFGFTNIASLNSIAAPAISLKIKTPGLFLFAARYSFATKFIPSRNGVTNAMSAILYIATNSSNGKL